MLGKKYGGRKKGTPNKKTVLFSTVKEALDRRGLNPADVIIDIATGKRRGQNIDVVLRASGELLQYVAPKLTRSEFGGIGGGPVQMEMFESPAERIASKLDRIAARTSQDVAGRSESAGSSGA